jgi:hypothetical protein
VLKGPIGSPAAACSVAGGFCYGRLLDESRIARESQNSPSPARASDRLLSICVHEKHDVLSFFLGKRSLLVLRFASCEAVVEEPGDRRKLEELCSRKTSHRAIFSWQTQFAGAALRILRSSRGGAGGSAEARGAVFTKNTTSCRFFLANAVCWCCASHPAKQSWRSRGIGGSSRSIRIFRPSGECAAVGRGRRLGRTARGLKAVATRLLPSPGGASPTEPPTEPLRGR